MAVLLKCGAVFLHIPKTGGNWVSEILEERGLVFCNFGERHATLKEVEEFEKWFRITAKYGKPNRGFYKFCFVRHPLRWYESWFRMQKKLGWPHWEGRNGVSHPVGPLDGLADDDFNGFIRNVLDRAPGFVSRLYRSYVAPGVHFVGRQERMADDMCRILRNLNVPHDPERVCAHPSANVGTPAETMWDPDLRKRMEVAEGAAMRDFGYSSETAGQGEPKASMAPAWDGSVHEEVQLQGPYIREGANGWRFSLPAHEEYADDIDHPYRSAFILLEDEHALPSAHALHKDIREIGGGRYSHWCDYVLFSTVDNSDPNCNGRRYRMKYQVGSQGAGDSLMVQPYHPLP